MDRLMDARGWLPLLFCAFIALLAIRCGFEAWRRHRKGLPSVHRHAISAIVFASLAPLVYSPRLGTLPVLAAVAVALIALETKHNHRRKLVDGVAGLGVIASVTMLLLGLSPVLNYGPSMWPTAPDGWSVSVVDFAAYKNQMPDRGDQVQVWVPKAFNEEGFDSETSWPGGRYHKRVFALAGDRVQIDTRQMSINGKKVADCTQHGQSVRLGRWMCHVSMPGKKGSVVEYEVVWGDDLWMGAPLDQVVPAGQMFLMGDNVTESADSRDRGTLPVEWIVGRAL